MLRSNRLDSAQGRRDKKAKQGYATYNPAYVSMAYHLPSPHVYLTKSWLKEVGLDLVEMVKRMVIPRKNFKIRTS